MASSNASWFSGSVPLHILTLVCRSGKFFQIKDWRVRVDVEVLSREVERFGSCWLGGGVKEPGRGWGKRGEGVGLRRGWGFHE